MLAELCAAAQADDREGASRVWARFSPALLAHLDAEEGVLISVVGPRKVRLVTHLDVDDAACTRAADVLCKLL